MLTGFLFVLRLRYNRGRSFQNQMFDGDEVVAGLQPAFSSSLRFRIAPARVAAQVILEAIVSKR